MVNKRKVNVKWIGPDGNIDQNKNTFLLRLLGNKVLKKKYSSNNINEVKEIASQALRYLRKLFKEHELTSPYHNFGHNYVTAVTSIRGFIGALRSKKNLSYRDLRIILVTSLFHDTGYLKDINSKKEKEINVYNHSKNSTDLIQFFTKGILKWDKRDLSTIIDLYKYPNYVNWNKNKSKVEKDILAKILVGADFMQVVDKNYFKNLKVLKELIRAKSIKKDKAGQRKFFELSREVTDLIGVFIDTFYGSKEKNPYRKGWIRYEKTMKRNYM